ncbi:MAG: flagellar basal body rod protein FlgC [Verrucomicrobiales bacterium]|nr:flagellar basal body rod protein FlgC [Verrucomicrobiales bacterium]
MINALSGVDSAAMAMTAERVRMDVVSQNIANAHVTRGVDGAPYRRQQVVFETVLQEARGGLAGGATPMGVRVARIDQDPRAPRQVYNPAHPDANPTTGLVGMPNVEMHTEMVDMITSTRAFEANLMVVKTAKNLAMQTLGIGRR